MHDLFGTVIGACGSEVYVSPDGADNIHILRTQEFQSLGVVPLKGVRVKYTPQPDGSQRKYVLAAAQVLCWKYGDIKQVVEAAGAPEDKVQSDVISDGSHI